MLLLQLQLGGQTVTWGAQVLDSVWAGPVESNIQIWDWFLYFLFFFNLQLQSAKYEDENKLMLLFGF